MCITRPRGCIHHWKHTAPTQFENQVVGAECPFGTKNLGASGSLSVHVGGFHPEGIADAWTAPGGQGQRRQVNLGTNNKPILQFPSAYKWAEAPTCNREGMDKDGEGTSRTVVPIMWWWGHSWTRLAIRWAVKFATPGNIGRNH